MKITVGSVCSGIEAASVALTNFDFQFLWFSEIANFPSSVLKNKYPHIENVGDMNNIPEKLINKEIEAPDFICGGTPCQAFSFAGLQKGLKDERGNLSLKFVEIINSNDEIRLKNNKKRTMVFWENVEGVLSDKTNAFGCLVSSLAGTHIPFEEKKWPASGIIYGTKRNIAWRVMDAKYFGVPQQRKRIYLLAGDIDFHPENILFEQGYPGNSEYPKNKLCFAKDGVNFEVFREYTDCLYAAYGTKWNGNAAATNGSLFICQNERLRRLSPLETERLMGFPDNYTSIPNAKKTQRYQAIGNSWVVPVIKWIGKRIKNNDSIKLFLNKNMLISSGLTYKELENCFYFPFGKEIINTGFGYDCIINCTNVPCECDYGDMYDIVSPIDSNDIFISPVGCYGILRRKKERKLSINKRLEEILIKIASEMNVAEIEKKSHNQKRGKYSKSH